GHSAVKFSGFRTVGSAMFNCETGLLKRSTALRVLAISEQTKGPETSGDRSDRIGALRRKPNARPLTVSSVEDGIRAAHQRGECDRQDLAVPYSGPRSARPMRMPSESHQGYALVPGERDVSLCQQCPN